MWLESGGGVGGGGEVGWGVGGSGVWGVGSFFSKKAAPSLSLNTIDW